MIAHYKIDFNDLMALQKNGIKNSKTHKKYKVIFSIVVLVATFLTFYTFREGVPILISIVYSIINFFIAQVLYPLIATSNLKSTLKKKGSSAFGEHKVTISEEELYIERGKTPKKYNWTDIIRVGNDDDRYFFYVNDQNAIIIKKFPYNMNDNERVEFNAFINKILNNNSLLH
ncbi:hypothetical protein [Virgibacillus sp. CBA3643]|uniref:hypothetical protein n=1 Tax=Virgibacillus sp. CBA3643 TaxID=2942278 RepID=UPI0035A3D4AD